jgi:predicted RND superfamily exporter protein
MERPAKARLNGFMRVLRFAALAVFALLVFLSFPRLKFDNSLERWVPPGSPAIAHYRTFLEEFGTDTALIVVFHNAGGFEGPDSQKALMAFWDRLNELPGVTGVSTYPPPIYRLKKRPDKNIFALVATFTPPSHLNPNRPDLLRTVRVLLEDVPFESHLAGTGVLHEAINEETQRYTTIFIGLGLAFLAVLLLVVLKSARAFLMTVGVSAGGVMTLLITAGVFGIPLSMVTVVLPVLVLFYGTSSSLHVLFHRGDFRKVVGPCFMAILTTVIGFLTFLPSPVPLLRDFAALGIAGILGGFLWAVLLFFPRQYVFEPRHDIVRFFEAYPVFSRPAILVAFLAAAAAMVPGILRLKADIYSLDVISPFNSRVRDHHYIEEHVGRYVPLEYTVEIGRAKASELNDWISAVFKLDEVDGAVSYLNLSLFREGAGAAYFSRDGRLGRVTFLIPVLSTERGIALVGKIDDLAVRKLSGARPSVNGYVTLYAVVAEELRKAFLSSLTLAFLLIFVAMGVYLRNTRLLLASILPNILPIAFIVGLMGWSGLKLNMATVPIGCLMLGILVDNTLHILFWFKKTGSLREAIREAAPGMFLTSLILAVGFSVFLFASSPPIRYFGILSITALLTGLAGDCVLLPVLVRMATSGGTRRAANDER